MKKLILALCVAVAAILLPSRSHSDQFSIPYVIEQSTTITNASLVLSTRPFVNTQYMHCINHVTAESTAGGQFLFTVATVTSSGTLSPETTNYSIVLSTGFPYDSQWGNFTAWCGGANNQVQLKVTAGNYTISCEEFVTKGMNP